MGYARRKKKLLESLVKETEASFSELLSGGEPVVLNKEEDEVEELVNEILERFKIKNMNGRQ